MPEKEKLIIISGMWEKESQGAGVFFSGKLGKLPPGFELKEGAKLLMFKNKKPKQENSPTHHLMTEDTRTPQGGGDPEAHKVKAPPGFEGFGKPEDAAPW